MINGIYIEISISEQKLWLKEGPSVISEYTVSTARNGPGEILGSECTPRGKHRVAEKIGEGCPADTVFVGRRPTGECYTPELRLRFPDRDWILTRILWLEGCEPGFNQGGKVDSYRRYIYIHGSPDDAEMGIPGSRGCIRMRNHDIIDLFDQVCIGTEVNIF